MSRNFNPSLYFIADPECCGGRDIVDVVGAAVAAGVTMVQYRNKRDALNDVIAEAVLLKDWMPEGVPLLINDYVQVAHEMGADGVHIGQGDAACEDARALLGDDAIIGVTAFTPQHMAAIAPDVVDYVGTGPFYPTQTDKGKPVLGASRFAEIAALSPVPVVGIGGITADNAEAVRDAGAAGIAVMRAIGEAADIEAAVIAFKETLV